MTMYHLVCVHCGATYPADEIIYNCKKCGHLLAVKYPLDEITVKRATWDARPLSVWRYKELLPVHIKPVSLQEGGTPLYHLQRLGEEMGLKHLYAKHEGMNPSGSFKDRGMTVGVSMALQSTKRVLPARAREIPRPASRYMRQKPGSRRWYSCQRDTLLLARSHRR